MKKKIYYLMGILGINMLLNSCYNDKLDAIHPLDSYINPCSSAVDSTYNHSIKFIMANNCTSCHNTSYAQGGIVLDNYNSVVSEAKNGRLLGTIQHQSGYIAMPPSGLVPSCQIDKLKKWINANEPQ